MVVHELVSRLKSHFAELRDGVALRLSFMGPLPLQYYFELIDNHFEVNLQWKRLILNFYIILQRMCINFVLYVCKMLSYQLSIKSTYCTLAKIEPAKIPRNSRSAVCSISSDTAATADQIQRQNAVSFGQFGHFIGWYISTGWYKCGAN